MRLYLTNYGFIIDYRIFNKFQKSNINIKGFKIKRIFNSKKVDFLQNFINRRVIKKNIKTKQKLKNSVYHTI